jgi:hypothetical protein
MLISSAILDGFLLFHFPKGELRTFANIEEGVFLKLAGESAFCCQSESDLKEAMML